MKNIIEIVAFITIITISGCANKDNTGWSLDEVDQRSQQAHNEMDEEF